MSPTPTRLWFFLSSVLLLGLSVPELGCSTCGSERPTADRDDGGDREAGPRKKRRRERDGGSSEGRPSREPRPLLPEARLASVQGEVAVDTTTRVVIPRRRVVDGGVQVEVPDGGPGGVQAGRDGFEMQIGDTLRTGADGSVDLELPEDQGMLTVGPDSTVRVSRYSVNEWSILRGRVQAALKTPGRGRRVLKISTPSTLVTIAGNEAVAAVAEDGATRIYALTGTTKVRAATPRDEIELAEKKMVEVSLEGAAGAPSDVTGDVVAAVDAWRAERHAAVARDPAAVLRKLAKKMQEDLAGIDQSFAVLKQRREKNRDILKRSTDARAKRLDSVGTLQQELVENSRTLVESADLARGAAMRILLRNELFAGLKAALPDAHLGPGATQIEGMADRIATVQTETDAQFRRFPRRQRRERPGERPGRGMPGLPPLRGATSAPPRQPAGE